jgi:hypothetical protein
VFVGAQTAGQSTAYAPKETSTSKQGGNDMIGSLSNVYSQSSSSLGAEGVGRKGLQNRSGATGGGRGEVEVHHSNTTKSALQLQVGKRHPGQDATSGRSPNVSEIPPQKLNVQVHAEGNRPKSAGGGGAFPLGGPAVLGGPTVEKRERDVSNFGEYVKQQKNGGGRSKGKKGRDGGAGAGVHASASEQKLMGVSGSSSSEDHFSSRLKSRPIGVSASSSSEDHFSSGLKSRPTSGNGNGSLIGSRPGSSRPGSPSSLILDVELPRPQSPPFVLHGEGSFIIEPSSIIDSSISRTLGSRSVITMEMDSDGVEGSSGSSFYQSSNMPQRRARTPNGVRGRDGDFGNPQPHVGRLVESSSQPSILMQRQALHHHRQRVNEIDQHADTLPMLGIDGNQNKMNVEYHTTIPARSSVAAVKAIASVGQLKNIDAINRTKHMSALPGGLEWLGGGFHAGFLFTITFFSRLHCKSFPNEVLHHKCEVSKYSLCYPYVFYSIATLRLQSKRYPCDDWKHLFWERITTSSHCTSH